MITKDTVSGRKKLNEHRANLRSHFRQFQELATILMRKSLVRYSSEKHRFDDCIHAAGRSVSFKERQTVTAFLKLQRNIAQQSMLILELELAIEQEEAK